MAALRVRFLARAADDLATLATADDEATRHIAHRLGGSAGTFGFPEISDAALALDEALEASADSGEIKRLRAALAAALEVAI
jgi:HPt (histidine-containing phosphotransfer) domain-containing protein